MFRLACEVAFRAATCKSGRKRPLCKFGCAARSSVSERVLIVLKDALSSYSTTHHKQERIETNGDGVKPGPPPAGHGGANVQLGQMRPSLNIFTPSPFVSELYANSCNTRSEGAACSNGKLSVRPLTWEYCSPSFPSGFPPPLGKSSVLLKCGIYFSFFLIEFESRIEIIKRRTVLTEHRSRGEEGDSTRTAPVST